jgi:alpha-tubulin suppressor-like RCC1 family protein
MKVKNIRSCTLGLLGLALSAVLAMASPVINTAPTARTVVNEGNALHLSVAATGNGTLSYQWYHNNRIISGATAANYTATHTLYSAQGAYTVAVTDTDGTTRATGFVNVLIPGHATAVAWGSNWSGQTTIPDGLTDVVAIAAGYNQTVALKADGTVVTWGYSGGSIGQATQPAGLTGVVTIAACGDNVVALKADGTVVAWGPTYTGQTNVPTGLTGGVAIAAGSSHTVALKADGTVVAWGYNGNGQTTIPDGLSNVVAITAGNSYTVALKADGTVVAWGYNEYGQTTVPAGLSGVVAIAASDRYTVALKADGTVVSWGLDSYIATPAGLTDVVSIAFGDYHAVALKADGTVVAWGENYYGQTALPALSGVAAIAAGSIHSVALITESAPVVTTPLASTSVAINQAAILSVSASGNGLAYQWYHNGELILGATAASYALNKVNYYDAGAYRVAVTNQLGTVESAEITVTVTLPSSLGSAAQAYDLLYGFAFSPAKTLLDAYIAAKPNAADLPLARLLRSAARFGSAAAVDVPAFLKTKLGAIKADPAALIVDEESVTFPLGLRTGAQAPWTNSGNTWHLPANTDNGSPSLVVVNTGANTEPFTLRFAQAANEPSFYVHGTIDFGTYGSTDNSSLEAACGGDSSNGFINLTTNSSVASVVGSNGLAVTLLPGEALNLGLYGNEYAFDVTLGGNAGTHLHVAAADSDAQNYPRLKSGSNLTYVFAFLKAQDAAVLAATLDDLNAIPAAAVIRLAAGDVGTTQDIVLGAPERELFKGAIKLLQAVRLLGDTYDLGLDLSNGTVFETPTFDAFWAQHPQLLTALATANPADRAQAKALLQAAVAHYRGVENDLWSRPARTDGAIYLVSITADLTPTQAAQSRAEISKGLDRLLATLSGPMSFDDYLAKYPRFGVPVGTRLSFAPFFAAQPFDLRANLPANAAGFLQSGPGLLDGLLATGVLSGLTPGQLDEVAASAAPSANLLFAEVRQTDWVTAAGFAVRGIVPHAHNDAVAGLAATSTYVLVVSPQQDDNTYRLVRLNLTAAGGWTKAWELTGLANDPTEQALLLGSEILLCGRQVISQTTGLVAGEVAGAPADWTVYGMTGVAGAYAESMDSALLTRSAAGEVRWHSNEEISTAAGFDFIGGNRAQIAIPANGYASTGFTATTTIIVWDEQHATAKALQWDGGGWTVLWSKDLTGYGESMAGSFTLLSDAHWLYAGRIFSCATGDVLLDPTPLVQSGDWENPTQILDGFYSISGMEGNPRLFTLDGNAHLRVVPSSAITSVLTASLLDRESLVDSGVVRFRQFNVAGYAKGAAAPVLASSPKFIVVRYWVTSDTPNGSGLQSQEKYARLDWNGTQFTMSWSVASRLVDYMDYSSISKTILDARYFTAVDGIRSLATGRLVADSNGFSGYNTNSSDYLAPFYFDNNSSVILDGLVVGSYQDNHNSGMNKVSVLRPLARNLTAPTIQTQPVGQTVNQGQTATFAVSAGGSAASAQWFFKGGPITGATSSSYSFTATTATVGSYTVTLTNAAGTATSEAAALTVILPPAIIGQPQGQNVKSGDPVTVSVTASGSTANYQWALNGNAIAGATEASYRFTATTETAGVYTVTLANAAGTVTSEPAAVVVAPTLLSQPQAVTVNQGQTAPSLSPPEVQMPTTSGPSMVPRSREQPARAIASQLPPPRPVTTRLR